MKLSTLVVLFCSSLAVTASLEFRQRSCTEDRCWNALWGAGTIPDQSLTAFSDCQKYMTTSVVVYPIATTITTDTITSTAFVACATNSASPASSSGLNIPSSSSSFIVPTEPLISISILPGETASSTPVEPRGIEARQGVITRSSSTITIYGSIPTYAAQACGGSKYASACLCKNVDQSLITLISSTVTDTTTSMSTATTTSTSCSSTFTITMTYNSSTSMTTLTMTSNPDDTSTGTGTGSITNTISSTIASYPTFVNTTKTSLPPPGNTTTTLPPFTNITTATLTTSNTTIVTPTLSPPTCGGLGVVLCNGINCVDTKTDTDNCGRCGNKCKDDMLCINGVCAREPCDSDCSWNRSCAPRNSTLACVCATEEQGHGICFDKDRYQCSGPSVTRCRTSSGCPVGNVCVKSICNCSAGPEDDNVGICVSSEGCGEAGVENLGPLVRIGEMEKRRRSFKLDM